MYGKKHYHLLGRLLVSKKPEIAHELLSTYCNNDVEPVLTDLDQMERLFICFCHTKGIDPELVANSFRKSLKIEYRKEFIAVMLHLYTPQVYFQPVQNIVLRLGFVGQVVAVLRQDYGNISKMIREVIIWEREYDEFKEKVSTTVLLLKKEVPNG